METTKEKVQSSQPGLNSKMEIKPIHIYDSYTSANRLKGKVAVITGADSGIGKAIALHYIKEGAKIAFTYHSKEKDDAKQTIKELNKLAHNPKDIIAYELELKNSTECNEFIVKVHYKFGTIDILVNNTAVQFPKENFTDISNSQLKETFETNFYHYIYMTKAALEYMKKGACIINTTSVTAYKGRSDLIDYSSTKGAIVAFTRSLAKNIIKDGIRVNAVAPGPVWTPLIPSSFNKSKIEKFGENSLLGEPAHPADIAPTYVFLANEVESKYYTGQVLHPNGGEIVNS